MALVNPDEFFTHLDEIGETEVRKRLASGAVYGGDKSGLVGEWLRTKDQERSDAVLARSEASNREQIRIARNAKNAAWAAAIAAVVAAICAIIALLVR